MRSNFNSARGRDYFYGLGFKDEKANFRIWGSKKTKIFS